MPLEPTRILITGANGFVGRHLLTALLAPPLFPVRIFAATHAESEPHSSTHAPPGSGQGGPDLDGPIDLVPLDVRDAAATAALLTALRPTQVYHLAARASGADPDREAVFSVNVDGSRNLLAAARSLPSPPRVLLVSTGYVYGDTEAERPARESDSLASLGRFGAYTDSKIAMEAVAAEYRDLAFTVRAFSHTGPGQAPTFAAPAFARQIALIERGEQPPELLVGNLEARRDLLDVRDVVRAYRLLMEQATAGETYNVATGAPIAMREVLDRLRALCSVPIAVKTDPARMRPADIACSTGDPRKLCAATRWQPRYSLETTLHDTLSYWRSEVS